jgi:dipeptidyl aminopeptidase/acylaminoacyl peptidase
VGPTVVSRVDEYDLERYLTVRSAYGATLGAPDGLAFLYDATGVGQVWTLDEPGGWPEQRTFYDEPVSFVTASEERPEYVFGMDEGGNERLQLFRLDADDGRIVPLTETPDAKHRWGGWDSDGERIAFAANRRDESVFDVYVQGRDEHGDAARLVHEGDGWLSLGGWSPDGERLLVVESYSSFDQDVSVLDLATGEGTSLTPDDEDVRYGSVQWGPDGEGIYCVTDRDADTQYLARLDARTGDVETVADGGDWEIDGVAIHEDSGLIVYSRNVEGYTELTLGELAGPTTIEPIPTPSLPGGIAGGVTVAPDGDTLALSASGRAHNTNVYVCDVEQLRGFEAAGGATDSVPVGGPAVRAGIVDGDDAVEAGTTRWTRASTAGIPAETFVEPELIRYESFDGREIPAFVSMPPDATAGETPVIVDVHGGPESQRRPSFTGLTQYFLSRGYAVFEPNVRGSTGYGRAYTHLDDVEKRMDSVRDLAAAHEWLAAHEAVDPDRIAIQGGSYGGFMVLAALTSQPERWAAGVDVVGIANFVTFLENTGSWRRELREAEYGSLEEDRELLEELSPITHAHEIDAPLFVLHGANDPRVPVGEAEQIAEEAREQGVPVELLVFEDEGHGISKLENRIEAYTRVVAFLDEYV